MSIQETITKIIVEHNKNYDLRGSAILFLSITKAMKEQHERDMRFARWYATFTDYNEINAQDYNTLDEAFQYWEKEVEDKNGK